MLFSISCSKCTFSDPLLSIRMKIAVSATMLNHRDLKLFQKFGLEFIKSETSVIERVWGDPHQDKSHRRTGCQMAILLNMGGSCSVCVPLYITKRSEAVLQWGKRKIFYSELQVHCF